MHIGNFNIFNISNNLNRSYFFYIITYRITYLYILYPMGPYKKKSFFKFIKIIINIIIDNHTLNSKINSKIITFNLMNKSD